MAISGAWGGLDVLGKSELRSVVVKLYKYLFSDYYDNFVAPDHVWRHLDVATGEPSDLHAEAREQFSRLRALCGSEGR